MLISLVITSVFPTIEADEFDYSESREVSISPRDTLSLSLKELDEGEKLDLSISSEYSIDMYIIKSQNFKKGSTSEAYFENASYARRDITDLKDNWTKPDDADYRLVVVNDGDRTTQVEVSYSSPVEDQEVLDFIKKRLVPACFLLIGLTVALIAVVIILIVVVLRNT